MLASYAICLYADKYGYEHGEVFFSGGIMRKERQKLKGLQNLAGLILEKAESSPIAVSVAFWNEKFLLLDDPEASTRLGALKFLREQLRGNMNKLLPYALKETGFFSQPNYCAFGPLILLALKDPMPYKIMEAALKDWRWRDRGTAWDVTGQPNNLYARWKTIYVGDWPKESLSSLLVFLPLGAANLDSEIGGLFSPKLQFEYLTKHFFRPRGMYASNYMQSDEPVKQFFRQRIADFMAGYFNKGPKLYERKRFGNSKHWHSCYQVLSYVKLANIPEALGHLVYLCLRAWDEDEYSRLFNILQTEYPWFPESSIEILKQVRNGGLQGIYQQQSPLFDVDQNDLEHRQYLGIAYNLAVKAMIEYQLLSPEQACKWLTAFTPIDETYPHLWLARVEALAACGSWALEELEKMFKSSAQPPFVRRYMAQYIALMQDEAGLPLLCKILTEALSEKGDKELIEGCLICLSRLEKINSFRCVVEAITHWWNNQRTRLADEEDCQFCLALALRILSLVQFEDSSAMNENGIVTMLEAGLSSSDQRTQLAALHAHLVLAGESVSMDADTIGNFRKIILGVAKSGKNADQLSRVLKLLSTQGNVARDLFDLSFSLEMLCNVPPHYQSLILKLIRKTYPDLKDFFSHSINGGVNLLAQMLSEQKDAGTRLAALTILWNYPELWELEGVYENVLRQAKFNTNKEPATAAKALELLAASWLSETKVQEAILDFCSHFKEAPGPSMTAVRLIENNFFDFELGKDLGDSLQKAINDCYGNFSKTEKLIYSSVGENMVVFALCRLYGLLLRARIIYPRWPNFSILLKEALGCLNRAPRFWVRNGTRAIKTMLSSYRLALEADQSQTNDNFTGALNAVSSSSSRYINRSQLLAAFLGLNLFREPPFELHQTFQQYNRQISALLTDEIQQTSDTNVLREFTKQARMKVRAIYDALPMPGRQGSVDQFSSHPFPDSDLSCLLQKYLEQPNRDTYHEIMHQIGNLFHIGEERNWSELFRQHSVAYLAARHASQYHWWLCTARDRFHNADNQISNLDNATTQQVRAQARRFLGIPALINSLMLDRPKPILIVNFLMDWKRKFEAVFQCPEAITIDATDAHLSVYFDPRRLESVLENCFSNALHSVERYNTNIKALSQQMALRTPEVAISVTRQDSVTIIKVKDNGEGFSSKFLEELNREENKGKGLGTTIIQEYVEKSRGGFVQWANNNPANNNEGAHIILYLPDREIFDE